MHDFDFTTRLALISSAEMAFATVSAILRRRKEERDDPGGMFCLYTKPARMVAADISAYTLQLASRVGRSAGQERDAETYKNCFEKATRLALFPNRYHTSAWGSRDFRAGSYGGAIKIFIPGRTALVGIVSFSGLIEHGDEALNLLATDRMGWQSWRTAIALQSRNPLLTKSISWAMEEPDELDAIAA